MKTCPHCMNRVLPNPDGTCPACQESIPHPGTPPEESPEAGTAAPLATGAPVTVRGRRRAALPFLVMGTIFCCVLLVGLVSGQAHFPVILVLVLVVPGVLWSLSLFIRPPVVALRDGRFSIQFGMRHLECPASRVGDVLLEGKNLRVVLTGVDDVEPEHTREGLARQFARRGAHFELAGGFFTSAEIDEIRRGVGLRPSTEAPVSRVDAFHRNLQALTPGVFVTQALVTVNVAVFLAMSLWAVNPLSPDPIGLVRWGANYAPRTLDGESWRLLTCAFLHIGIFHLLFNMWVLWAVGGMVERLLGNVGYIVVYVLSALAGSLAAVYWHPVVVSAGASGAVFGLFGALLGFVLLRRGSIPAEALRDLRNSSIGFLLFNLLFGFTVPGIDMAAHLGGFAAGLVCGLALSSPLTREVVARRRVRSAAVAVIGAGLLVVGLGAMPEAPADFLDDLEHFRAVEREVIDLYNSALDETRSGRMEEADFADVIERDIMPPWREARQRLAALGRLPEPVGSRISEIEKYAALRLEAWGFRVEATRTRDPAVTARYRDSWEAAESMLRKLADKP